MTVIDQDFVSSLILNWENEVVEFKNVSNSYSNADIAKYVSALANEANLRNKESAWLVFGVENISRKVVGSTFRIGKERLQGTKNDILSMLEPSITFRDIHEIEIEGKRLLLFEIPPAPLGIPISCNGYYYARAGESLVALTLDKLDDIRKQVGASDWSAGIVPKASLLDLDRGAIEKSRRAFAQKYANRFQASEVMSWTDAVFLERVKLLVNGQVTRAALLLLGRPESVHFLSPHPVQMTWKLEGPERAYEHFGPPFIVATTALYQKIRNIQIRILPENELFAREVAKYDQKIILEGLHNCIAHQDYRRNGRIVVTEYPDKLTFENEGGFFEGHPADYVAGTKTPRRYRNPCLAQAMSELNMIDTMGYGIHEMYKGQAARFFPMPEYPPTNSEAVKLLIYGKIIDPAYSRLLIQKTQLLLEDIVALDKVQKKMAIEERLIKHLRQLKLIEGRKPNIHVAASVASVTGTKVDYIRTRRLDDIFYIKIITDYIRQFGSATRQEIDQFIIPKLSEALTDKQKKKKVDNLLSKMRQESQICNAGSFKKPKWELK